MNEIVIYLVKVSLAISLLTIPYYLFLRNDPMLIVKRSYLAGGIILAWIFPLMVMNKPSIASSFEPVFFIDPGSPAFNSIPVNGNGETGSMINLALIPVIAYLAGILLLLTRNTYTYLGSKRMHTVDHIALKNVVFTDREQVYTIFPRIYIPKKYSDNKDLDSILIHERAHIRQLHFIDLLIAEITLLLTWFNPFSWLISRMIKENHEHLADRSVLRQGINPAHYKALLLNHALGGEVFRLGHQFNHSLTKKRFDMMKKMKASKKGMLKYLIIIPVILAFTLLATATAQESKTIHGTVYLEKKGEAAVGASVVVANSTIGTVVDMDGKFSLQVDGNPEIVISFVGYMNVRKTANEIAAAPVIMEPVAYKIILDDIEAIEPVKEIKKEKDLAQQDDGEIFYVVEDLPSFPGGKSALKKYIDENLVYPEVAGKKKIEGKVLIQFKVSGKGALSEIEVLESTDPSFSKSAISLIEGMPDWNPGKQRGKAVNSKVILPVVYKIKQEDSWK